MAASRRSLAPRRDGEPMPVRLFVLFWTEKYPCAGLSGYLWRAVEDHPDGEVLRNSLEPMRNVGGAEPQVAGANLGHVILYPVTAGAGGDEIQFVAEVRNLWAIPGSSGEPYFQVSVNEHLSRAAWRARECKRGGKGRWRWREVHRGLLSAIGLSLGNRVACSLIVSRRSPLWKLPPILATAAHNSYRPCESYMP
jgi:hypothetical protein